MYPKLVPRSLLLLCDGEDDAFEVLCEFIWSVREDCVYGRGVSVFMRLYVYGFACIRVCARICVWCWCICHVYVHVHVHVCVHVCV
eukprot:m.59687 g.59687  ORF g.59687 m.59687 type:complete len:86 (-) comp22737_c3_seq1:50-307(-)